MIYGRIRGFRERNEAVECFRRVLRLDSDYEGAKDGLVLAQAKL